MLGLSNIASKVSAVNWLAEETAEVLAIEKDVMAWAANNTDLLVDPTGIGGWVVEVQQIGGSDIISRLKLKFCKVTKA